MKSCKDCRHNEICFLYRDAVVIKKTWEETNTQVQLPLLPEQLAISCNLFESPADVIKKSNTTKEIEKIGI